MDETAVCKVRDIDPAARAWLVRMFGHDLAADQAVVLTLPDDHAARQSAGWTSAWATIHQILDEAAGSAKQAEPAEFESALDEAMRLARPRHGS